MTGLWDIYKYAIEDKYSFRPPMETSIQPHQFQHWFERVEQFVDLVSIMFPKAFKMWRFVHYCNVKFLTSHRLNSGRVVRFGYAQPA